MKATLSTAILFCAVGAAAQAASLLANGDFEAGNTGFSSALAYTPLGNSAAAQYTVGTAPKSWNGLFVDIGDHTSGSGNMMIVNGASTVDEVVWSQTVSVMSGTNYTFSGWITNLYNISSAISVSINGVTLGSNIVPGSPGVWEAFSRDWNSGSATSATINLLQQTTGLTGNDYALDDLSFAAPVPLPAAAWCFLAGLGMLAGMRRRRSSAT